MVGASEVETGQHTSVISVRYNVTGDMRIIGGQLLISLPGAFHGLSKNIFHACQNDPAWHCIAQAGCQGLRRLGHHTMTFELEVCSLIHQQIEGVAGMFQLTYWQVELTQTTQYEL